MLIQFIGKFYDNHSLSIINRNLVVALDKKGIHIHIISLDKYDPIYAIDKDTIKTLKRLENTDVTEAPEIQFRHSYPPIWAWPESSNTKIVYMQPWEYPKALFEWQYKFETFADAVIIPSNYCRQVFLKGGLNPSKMHVIPNGYDTSVFNREPGNSVEQFGIDASKFNFIYVGNPQWRKGLDILLNAWSRTFSKADNARLIIKDNSRVYGASNIVQELINLEYKTDCAPITYIDEELSATKMADLYKASKILVHPYRAEGFGMHVQEAAACGCVPIVPIGGPTDDFIPEGKGFKLSVQQIPVNIADSNLFALKPGDATTMMSTHTFMNEPSLDHLITAMSFFYHSHDREYVLNNSRVENLNNTWDAMADSCLKVFNTLEGREVIRK
jgi:glycosyltransferase involved in cell wall biosynthesis